MSERQVAYKIPKKIEGCVYIHLDTVYTTRCEIMGSQVNSKIVF